MRAAALLHAAAVAAAAGPPSPIRHDYGPRTSNDSQPPKFNPRRMRMHREMAEQIGGRGVFARVARGPAPCVDGHAGEFPCRGVDLVSFVPAADMGHPAEPGHGPGPGDRFTSMASDIWGWVDPDTGREIVLFCLVDSMSFVDITDAGNPTVLAWMAGTRSSSGALQSSYWRDAKVYKNHVFIGADSVNNHGIQVFDLTRLRQYYGRTGVVVPSVEPDHTYEATGLGPSHNVVLNEETGFLYVVGSRSYQGGPHILDVSDPKNPRFVAGFDRDGYTHDAEAVVYHGPDTRYLGHEIYFGYNEDTLTILDVSDKDNINILSRAEYEYNYYTHQGWLTGDHTHLLLNDEADESRSSQKHTRTLQWNVEDLHNPRFIGSHISTEQSIDHNLYINGSLAYMANYCSGLRVLDTTGIARRETPEVGFFDTAPYCDTTVPGGVVFEGAWSNYPFFPSGNAVVSNIETGLFVLRVHDRIRGLTK